MDEIDRLFSEATKGMNDVSKATFNGTLKRIYRGILLEVIHNPCVLDDIKFLEALENNIHNFIQENYRD